jgi:hypothetical protein
MSIDSLSVGSNQRQINIVGDPNTASNYTAVLALADALSLAGKFGLITGGVHLVQNAGGTFDIARAAPGVTGIPSVSTEGTKATFSYGLIGFTPVATPTDFLTITGSGTKTIRVTRVEIHGISTSGASVDLQLLRRTTANSGGTSTNPAAVLNDTNNAAATATLTLYTANPTTGTSAGSIRSGKLNLGVAGVGGSLVWDFGTRNSQGVVLRGTTQSLCINWSGAAVPAGTVLAISIEWVEDAS